MKQRIVSLLVVLIEETLNMNETNDKIIYVKGHALKIYSDDYVRENGKKVDEITIGYGGVGGQYVYLNTSDNCGYELPVSGLIYEEYPDGRLWYYTTCNDAGFACRCDSAEYYENGSLHNAAYYSYEGKYSVTIRYDKNGNLLSECFNSAAYEENTFINLNGKNNEEIIRDKINKIEYLIEFDNNGEILEFFTRGVNYKINGNEFVMEFCKENETDVRHYFYQLDVADVFEESDFAVFLLLMNHTQKKLEFIKMVWNEKGTLICKHEFLKANNLIHGVYWNDKGNLCEEHLGFLDFLIELVFDENEKISECKLWTCNDKYKGCFGRLKIDKRNKDVFLIDDKGDEVFSVKHNNQKTVVFYNIDGSQAKITLSTIRSDEKAVSTVNAPKNPREFADFLFDKTKKYLKK